MGFTPIFRAFRLLYVSLLQTAVVPLIGIGLGVLLQPGANTGISGRPQSGKQAGPFLALNASALAVIQKVLWWIIRVAPLGKFTAAIYIGLALIIFGVYHALVAKRQGILDEELYNAHCTGDPFKDDVPAAGAAPAADETPVLADVKR